MSRDDSNTRPSRREWDSASYNQNDTGENQKSYCGIEGAASESGLLIQVAKTSSWSIILLVDYYRIIRGT